ncbi:MAG: molybdopterin-dependent oxidoreductase [Bacteroidetes bacterium]|nr:molybdopterin-dependent oxidoreductase [Bacteroidota bacterium]
MKNIDSISHLQGKSIYLDDLPTMQGTLYCAIYDAPIAHAKIKNLDLSIAEKSEGVVKIFTYKDINGANQIGGIILDEQLLAEDVVDFCGMPIALIVANTSEQARSAAKKIKCEFEALPIITDPREAMQKGKLIIPPRTFKIGNTDDAWILCEHIFEGKADTNGQEHLYIETQGAYAIPLENESIKIYSSTQGPTAVQRITARVLGIGMHQIEVDVTRLGGGFGGKEDQATTWAIMCALAAQHLKVPVKFSLDRLEDMRMTGKRHPYSSDFKIGLDKNLKIIAYEATFYQNAGAAADLSPAVMERTLFHSTNTYFIPNATCTAYSCKTNLPPNTAFRGFGGPQGMFVIEAAIAKAAAALGIDAYEIQQCNLMKTGDEFLYGQKVESEAIACWEKAVDQFELKKRVEIINNFNKENQLFKKGIALMPICFGISFTKTLMNNARALVHIYSDGTVGISTGAVEMGQGVNTKILQVAAKIFSLNTHKIKINSTNTYRIANTSPSAASATADLNGRATQMACEQLLERLKIVAAEMLNTVSEKIEIINEKIFVENKETEITWEQLILAAFLKRINLSEHAHYATPDIHFDSSKEKGHPFAYHVFGTSIFEVTIDCIRGTYRIDDVRVMHDVGKSMNHLIDRGQCEGGIVQGIGWMTMEEVIYDKNGKLRSNALSTYKVPDIYSVPKVLDVLFHESPTKNLAILNSKAVGEPPIMYGIGAYFALRNAILAFNPKADLAFDAPFTPEKVLLALYAKTKV